MRPFLGQRYRLIERLGRGNMGEVWGGFDTKLERPVAVKILRVDYDATGFTRDELIDRFRSEAQAVILLNHPNIVTAYDFEFDAEADTFYLVMELIVGQPLDQELAERIRDGSGPLPLERVLTIATEVCAGLTAAHSAAIVHRDLKPANLMRVASTGQLKIVDFGIAWRRGRPRLSGSSEMFGTVAYMPPEYIETGEIDHRGDLYSLGCVLFELLTGKSPYPAQGVPQFVKAHLNDAPRPLRLLLPTAPASLESLLLDMLRKSPNDRPSSADDVAQRIAEVVPGSTNPVPPVGVTAPSYAWEDRATVGADRISPMASAGSGPLTTRSRRGWVTAGVVFGAVCVTLFAVVLGDKLGLASPRSNTAVPTTGPGHSAPAPSVANPTQPASVQPVPSTTPGYPSSAPTGPTPTGTTILATVPVYPNQPIGPSGGGPDASYGGVDTGLRVRRNEQLHFAATGEIVYGQDQSIGGCGSAMGVSSTDPAGNVTIGGIACHAVKYDSGSPIPNAPVGSLIARIDTGPWFFVGSTPTLNIPTDGELWLGYNDYFVDDNSNSFNVTISSQ